jgi:hypothetical protein
MPIPILQGTLDLMILRTLAAMVPQHAAPFAGTGLLELFTNGFNRGVLNKTDVMDVEIGEFDARKRFASGRFSSCDE